MTPSEADYSSLLARRRLLTSRRARARIRGAAAAAPTPLDVNLAVRCLTDVSQTTSEVFRLQQPIVRALGRRGRNQIEVYRTPLCAAGAITSTTVAASRRGAKHDLKDCAGVAPPKSASAPACSYAALVNLVHILQGGARGGEVWENLRWSASSTLGEVAWPEEGTAIGEELVGRSEGLADAVVRLRAALHVEP